MSFEALMLLFAAIEAAAASLVLIRAALEKNRKSVHVGERFGAQPGGAPCFQTSFQAPVSTLLHR
jgi:hypothetical protein